MGPRERGMFGRARRCDRGHICGRRGSVWRGSSKVLVPAAFVHYVRCIRAPRWDGGRGWGRGGTSGPTLCWECSRGCTDRDCFILAKARVGKADVELADNVCEKSLSRFTFFRSKSAQEMGGSALVLRGGRREERTNEAVRPLGSCPPGTSFPFHPHGGTP